MSAKQVREAMLSTAVAAVNASGLTVSLDHISMDQVILEAGVARSAAYRVWPRRSEFAMDLLLEVAKSSTVAHAAYDPETLRLALEAARKWRGNLKKVEARRAALIEACRVGVLRNFEALSNDGAWETEVALRATIMSFPPERREELRKALDGSVDGYISTLASFYRSMGELLGFEMTADRDYEFLAATGSAIVEGLLLRGPGQDIRQPTTPLLNEQFQADPFGVGTQTWNAASISFTANVLALVKPVENFDSSNFERLYQEADRTIHDLEEDPSMWKQGTAKSESRT